jgi:hypothetical protein
MRQLVNLKRKKKWKDGWDLCGGKTCHV